MDFKNLVLNELLFEAEPTPSAPPSVGTPIPAASTTPSNPQTNNKENYKDLSNDELPIREFFDTVIKKPLETLWNTSKFKDDYNAPWPDEPTINALFRYTVSASVRSSGLKQLETYLIKYLPLIELFAQLHSVGEKKKADKGALQAVWNTFQNNFKKYMGDPYSFPVTDPFTIQLKKMHEQKGASEVSKLALNNPDVQKLSILDAIKYFLKLRKIRMSFKMDIKSKALQVDSTPYVNDLVLQFNKYGKGEIKVPANFKGLYDDMTPRKLVDIADAAYAYFSSESKRLGKNIEQEKLLEAYKAFVQNTPLVKNESSKDVFDWNSFIEASTPEEETPELTTSSYKFDNVYNRALLGEMELLDEENARERRLKRRAAKRQAKATEPTEDATTEQAQEYEGGYIIKNIPDDSTVYKKLLELANYIKQSEFDLTGVLSGVAGIAKAISSAGGPMMR
jgi:hypothetical protein